MREQGHTDHAQDDGQFPALDRRHASSDQVVGKPARDEAGNEAATEGDPGSESGVDRRHVPLNFEIARQPGDKNPGQIYGPEEAENHTPSGAVSE